MTKQLEKRARLLEIMVDAGHTAETLAKATGLTTATIYRILRGERCFPATATKIARVLNKRASDLNLP